LEKKEGSHRIRIRWGGEGASAGLREFNTPSYVEREKSLNQEEDLLPLHLLGEKSNIFVGDRCLKVMIKVSEEGTGGIMLKNNRAGKGKKGRDLFWQTARSRKNGMYHYISKGQKKTIVKNHITRLRGAVV